MGFVCYCSVAVDIGELGTIDFLYNVTEMDNVQQMFASHMT